MENFLDQVGLAGQTKQQDSDHLSGGLVMGRVLPELRIWSLMKAGEKPGFKM